mgnify:CR=1 FL=1|jgi:hypothetical protein
MKKTLYRLLLKSCTFEGSQPLPSFKLKIGKQERLINPFCTAGV